MYISEHSMHIGEHLIIMKFDFETGGNYICIDCLKKRLLYSYLLPLVVPGSTVPVAWDTGA